MNTNKTTFSERLRNDDRSVVDEIYAFYHRRLFRFALAYLKNDDDSYDIVQDVFLKIWENRFRLRYDTNFDAFIFTVAKNSVLSLLRKRLSEQKYQSENSAVQEVDHHPIEEDIDYRMIQQKYTELVDQLPSKRKEIFKLSRDSGLSNKEIASQKGISEKTVEDHLTKSLSFLRRKLGKFGLTALLYISLFID
ncbi:MAG: hypothetical protein BGP01_03085 [Paludibacter sp. 47-17]|nr:MAG: hypothetical protein ABS72_01755 [Paludibacter sp. SCN 50-10]OJX91822.1 MAG: hypothetical protein BGP01_03085 [Paludibacter sp. 47-17]